MSVSLEAFGVYCVECARAERHSDDVTITPLVIKYPKRVLVLRIECGVCRAREALELKPQTVPM